MGYPRATGATAYMQYSEVKTYEELYDLQQQLNRVQEQLLNNFISSLPPTDPKAMSDSELESVKQGLQRTISYLGAGRDVARGLQQEYSKALAAEQH